MQNEKICYWEKYTPIKRWFWKNNSLLIERIKSKFLYDKVTGIKFNSENKKFIFKAYHWARMEKKFVPFDIKELNLEDALLTNYQIKNNLTDPLYDELLNLTQQHNN